MTSKAQLWMIIFWHGSDGVIWLATENIWRTQKYIPFLKILSGVIFLRNVIFYCDKSAKTGSPPTPFHVRILYTIALFQFSNGFIRKKSFRRHFLGWRKREHCVPYETNARRSHPSTSYQAVYWLCWWRRIIIAIVVFVAKNGRRENACLCSFSCDFIVKAKRRKSSWCWRTHDNYNREFMEGGKHTEMKPTHK